ncbi:peptide chain release factor N(5)-glutamine methyltransferase [Candidatus Saccharibacteria bacterium]|nr:peptide chain release factor N(5)-glutamine methyltransferase [Candidatus Saccharibacteria bacterium]
MLIREWLISSGLPREDAELILAHALKKDRPFLVTHDFEKIESHALKSANFFKKQRLSGLPLAYILKSKNFYGRDFYVDRRVLIPRPESETIIDLAKQGTYKNILDLGTGSGCLAITLKLELKDATVTASDLSNSALNVARKNAKNLKANVKFVHSDLLDYFLKHRQKFDLIVANLPYVDKNWDWLDLNSLKHEPALALFSERGTALQSQFISVILKNRQTLLAENFTILLESDPTTHLELIDLIKKADPSRKIETTGFILKVS